MATLQGDDIKKQTLSWTESKLKSLSNDIHGNFIGKLFISSEDKEDKEEKE